MLVTIQEEISSYLPKESEGPTESIVRIRELRSSKKVTDEELGKFWSISENKEWLDRKWEIELYNHDTYLRLLDLREENKSIVTGKQIGRAHV